MNRRLAVSIAFLLAPAAALGATACDDAVLGVRPLPCDGSACVDASGGGGGCPEVDEPSCETGTPIAEHDAGCVVGYFCGEVCASIGGSCSSLAACPGGRWSTEDSDCSEAGGLGCCSECVPISAPPSDFCGGGPITEVHEGDCLVDFVCL